MNKNLIFKPVVYWGLALYILLAFPVLALGEQVAAFAFPEDHYFENVGAISLFAASIIMFYSFLFARKQILPGKVFWVKQLVYLGLAFVFFFGAGEEISWGQRIFNIKTPEAMEKINAQDEITVHNMEINGYSLPFESSFDVLWMSLLVLIPIANVFMKWVEERFFPIVHWGMGALFLFDYLFAKVAKIIFQAVYTYDQVPFIQAVQEIKESNYELLFAVFALFVLLELKRSSDKKAAGST